MESIPKGRVLKISIPTPPERLTGGPKGVEPFSRKVTVPVGGPGLLGSPGAGETVAVRVTPPPSGTTAGEAISRVEEA
jgi:hypothetical protein